MEFQKLHAIHTIRANVILAQSCQRGKYTSSRKSFACKYAFCSNKVTKRPIQVKLCLVWKVFLKNIVENFYLFDILQTKCSCYYQAKCDMIGLVNDVVLLVTQSKQCFA